MNKRSIKRIDDLRRAIPAVEREIKMWEDLGAGDNDATDERRADLAAFRAELAALTLTGVKAEILCRGCATVVIVSQIAAETYPSKPCEPVPGCPICGQPSLVPPRKEGRAR